VRYLASPRPVLGPCACTICGVSVFWARRVTTELGERVGFLTWREADGRLHLHKGQRQRRYHGRKREGRYPQIRHETIHHARPAW
jgi:hypothetical protein